MNKSKEILLKSIHHIGKRKERQVLMELTLCVAANVKREENKLRPEVISGSTKKMLFKIKV